MWFHMLTTLILLLFGSSWSTIDLNLPELEYVADHLKKGDCRKLVAALHDPNFDLVNNIDVAERKIPNDLSCLQLLLHWNSQPGEGKGETHLVLAHRLKQLGHDELADWLSRTVFHQLGQDFNRSLLENPFRELTEINEERESVEETLATLSDEEEDTDEWTPVDTILCVVILVSVGSIMFLAVEAGRFYFKRRRSNNEKEKYGNAS